MEIFKKNNILLGIATIAFLSGPSCYPEDLDASEQNTTKMAFWGKKKKEDTEKSTPTAPQVATLKKPDPLSPSTTIYSWLQTVSEVISLLETKAFRSPDFGKFFQEALKAVSDVDAHSAFFTQDAYKSAMESTSGEFSGIGVSIMGKNPDDDVLPIIEVIQGGPAQKAGIKSGDKIIEVLGEKLRGLTTDEVINKLKGKVGTEVTLKIIRDKKPLDFKVKRDIIKDQTSQCYHFKSQNIYYLSLKVFAETSAKQMSELLQKANEKTCKGIILDLRHNPGGTLNAAIDMASLFLEKGSLVVVTRNKKMEIVEKYTTKTEPLLNSDIPIFVLIDNLTASASEILAGALRHHSEKSYEVGKKKGRKFLVFLLGVQSFGKGSVQEVIPISNGCALKLTTMMYELPDDLSIQAKGVTPDFVFKPRFVPVDEMKWIEDLYGKETSLKHHISAEEAQGKPAISEEKVKAQKAKELKEKEKKEEDYTPEEWEKKRQEALAHDAQIAAAVNMISWLDFAKKVQPALVDTRQKALSFIKERYVTDDTVVLEKVGS